MQGAGVSPRHSNARLTDFPEEVREVVQRFVTSPGDGMFIGGPTGTGKTHSAAAVVRALLEVRAVVRFVRAEDLYTEIRATYKGEDLTEADILSRYRFAPVLAVD